MSGPDPQPATPPTFHLKIRVIDLAGEPFANRDYEIEWGGQRVDYGHQTSADGVVTAELNGNETEGVLLLGTTDGIAFVPLMTIPLRAVPSPPPPPPDPEYLLQFMLWTTDLGGDLRSSCHDWAWRLSNLGHLPGLWHLDWLDGDTLTQLRDAMRRYGNKNGVDLDELSADTAISLIHLDKLLRKEHDGV